MDEFLKDIIRQAGYLAKDYFERGVSYTSKAHLGDLLTEADDAVSEYLVNEIHKKYKDHHIHSEEMFEDINTGAQYEWVIDPIDGTRNFAMGISMWCILIAILRDGELIMSAVYAPMSDELFFAELGKGAFMNDKRIEVNKTQVIDHAFAICQRSGSRDFEHRKTFEQFITRLVKETDVWLHSYGTMLGTCYLASGGVDFFASNCGMDHDNLAPVLICREAGALTTDSDGNNWKRDRHDLVIANPKMHPLVMELFKR